MTAAATPGSSAAPLDLVSAYERVPPAVAHAHRAVPLREQGGRLVVAAEDPDDPRLHDALARLGHDDPALERWSPEDLRALLEGRYGASADLFELAGAFAARRPADPGAPSLDVTEDPAQAPAARLLDAALRAGEAEGATDLHLDSDPAEPRLRFRVDGVLSERPAPPAWLVPRVVGRIKALAGLELGESLHPQDGAFAWEGRRRSIDIRVSIVPAERGPAVVLRLLPHEDDLPDLPGLGMPADVRQTTREAAAAPDGLIVVAGPTGAGKTTTLHALLAGVPTARNVVSIEDPVELRHRGVRQLPVRRQAGLDFAGALRAVLRQDPDVILVGETRDRETATLVLQAAVAGHLVLTTVHASSAVGAFDRFLHLGADRALLADSARLVLAQRLVRRTCAACRGAGCLACEGAGLRGRVGVFEALRPAPGSAPPRSAPSPRGAGSDGRREREPAPGDLARRPDAVELARAVRATGHRSLAERAADLVEDGVTTEAEVRRVLGDGETAGGDA